MSASTPRVVRTLIVEDDPAIAALHRGYVEDLAGFALVGVAATVAEAVDLLQSEAPDLVLLDVRLPDGTGIGLLRAIRHARPEAFDVIMTTAIADHAHVGAAAHLGVVDYLVKPFTRFEFNRRLTDYRETFVRRGTAEPGRTLDQAEVDRLRGVAPAPNLPKGLSPATLELIADALDGQPRTASEVAEQVGLSRVSARRYLEHLVTEGIARSQPRYGTTGRPSTEYARAGS